MEVIGNPHFVTAMMAHPVHDQNDLLVDTRSYRLSKVFEGLSVERGIHAR